MMWVALLHPRPEFPCSHSAKSTPPLAAKLRSCEAGCVVSFSALLGSQVPDVTPNTWSAPGEL